MNLHIEWPAVSVSVVTLAPGVLSVESEQGAHYRSATLTVAQGAVQAPAWLSRHELAALLRAGADCSRIASRDAIDRAMRLPAPSRCTKHGVIA